MPSDKPWYTNDPKPPEYEYVHKRLPGGPEGCSVVNIDLVVRLHNGLYMGDKKGKLKFIDSKFGNSRIHDNYSELMTFKLIDEVFRNSTLSHRYEGFYEVISDMKNWHESETFLVNGVKLNTKPAFDRFLLGKVSIPPYDFNKGIEIYSKARK